MLATRLHMLSRPITWYREDGEHTNGSFPIDYTHTDIANETAASIAGTRRDEVAECTCRAGARETEGSEMLTDWNEWAYRDL